jgi:hypothetical protein
MYKPTAPANPPQPITSPAPPRDLIDFHLRWQEFRAIAAGVAARGRLSEAEHEVIEWLVLLADRVGPRDLDLSEAEHEVIEWLVLLADRVGPRDLD